MALHDKCEQLLAQAPDIAIIRECANVDVMFAVHPLVDFGFAFETSNVNRLDARTLGQDIPIALGNSHRFETYFCFGHGLLWQQFGLKSNGMAQS
jgi:hypothetical protein